LLIKAGADKVSITGYDLKTGITAALPADVSEIGDIILNCRLFSEIVRKLPDDVVTVEADGNNITVISCKMSEFRIVGTNAADYPDLPEVDNQHSVKITEKKIKQMIAQTNFAVSDNDSRPIHTGALFEVRDGVLTVVAVDGYRLALRRETIEESSAPECSFVVPGAALAEVEKIASDSEDPVSITLGTKHVMFSIGDTVLVSRRLEGEFLNYRNSIPQTSKYSVIADKKEMMSAVERVSLLISDKLKSPIRCVFGDGSFTVTVNSALGRAFDECAVKGNADGLEIGFNNRYLLDALKAADADEVKMMLTSGVSPCIITPTDDDGRFLYMVLPVRLKSNEG